jgi:hypothetical protein
MSDRQPEGDIASRWRREAREELRAAEVVAAHDEVLDRVAGFHARLAAERALKSMLIDRGVEGAEDPRSGRAPSPATGDVSGPV